MDDGLRRHMLRQMLSDTALSTAHEPAFIPQHIQLMIDLYGASSKPIAEHQGQIVMCSSHEEAFHKLCHP